MRNYRDVIVRPHISERTMSYIEQNNCYTFEVNPKASKTEIKKAVEEIFNVRVEKVNVMKVAGKVKTMGVFRGKTPQWKKAMVRLAEGDRIEIYEGM